MPYTDFHYTPTGTGVISGKEVLEQTEDAINDLGTQISGDVQTAIDTANNALNTANSASADAQNAVNTANTAYTAATNAQNTANTAQNTASNALTAAQNAQNDVNALGNRVTTAENNISQNTTDISGLTTRMGTAENNITTLQNDVVTAQGMATSAQNTATLAREQAYVLRYASSAVTPNSTIAYSVLNNTDNVKVGDSLIDTSGQVFLIVSVDSANQTVTVGAVLLTLALDADVVHKSGNETVGGIKTFSDDTYIKSLNFTNEVPSQSSSSSSLMPIIATITYGDSTPSAQARLNFRITADGSKSLYPNENNQYSLGLTSRKWSAVYGTAFYYGSTAVEFSEKFVTTDTAQTIAGLKDFTDYITSDGDYLGNEFSSNARTNLLLRSNCDTAGKSGAYISRFRQNKAQGSMGASDLQILAVDFLENEVRTNSILALRATGWINDVPTNVNIQSSVSDYSFGSTPNPCKINNLNPGALSFPDLSSGLDISSYINTGNSDNYYTPLVDGYISVRINNTSSCAIYCIQGDIYTSSYGNIVDIDSGGYIAAFFMPVTRNIACRIICRAAGTIVSAKFFPNLGNV